MSLPRFFLEDQVLSECTADAFPLRLSPEDAKHARALRLFPGEHIAVIDATQDYFECKIEDAREGELMVSITRHEDAPESGPQVIVVQGLAKGDKMDTVIRQGTELGVAAFVPLICERSVVKLDAAKAAKRTERWGAIVKSAAMQSGQPAIPEVAAPCTVSEACALLSGATAVLICWEEAPTTAKLHDAIKAALAAANTPAEDARIAVIIGPEGGLSDAEAQAFLTCNPRAHLVSLGDSILRTETAGVIAPALVLYELGCLGGA